MDVEVGVSVQSRRSSWGLHKATLLLAYQSFGVVYGDLCISPVYVYKNTFSGKLRLHEEDEEILGVLSLVLWSLTLIPLLKYIILVLGADDNGEGSIGIYNISKWNPSVVRALSPYYIYNFFRKAGKDGWSSLGGIVLCITAARFLGAEAMFADLGHFSKLSLRLGFTIVVYPCLVLAYMGEAAYLSKHREDLQSSFYKALPDNVFWPLLMIATLATVVGSQAIISATFSIISQCRAFGCFPRIKVVHTSSHVHGQIYIPEVNWVLMFLCLAVTVGFRDTEMIGNAYGLAVILVMFATTCLMFLVITTVWNRNVVWAVLFTVGFGSIELMYLSACLAKVPHGGWLPLLLSLVMLLAMSTWHYGTKKKQEFEVQNKVCLERFLNLSSGMGLVRVPGVGFVYSSAANGVPSMFAHFVTNFPAFHRVLIFVSLQTLTVPKVGPGDRFLVGRVGPPENLLFRCVVRYGYKEGRWDHFNFENLLLMKVVEFLRLQEEEGDDDAGGELMSVIPAARRRYDQLMTTMDAAPVASNSGSAAAEIEPGVFSRRRVRFEAPWTIEEMKKSGEVKTLLEERESGVSYMIGHTCVLAHESSSAVKKFAVNIVYGFLRRNSRRPAVELGVPHASLIEVGMTYRV
ncbi:hypothetical protein PR202_gb28187 [Eleusine coracana subsp. coracana]|uniref:Potassium transporter n=1 Tax=Eleusine coracana subsp. coracana TaxID=191504 RepID=A0AAV5FY84_ELECO|nr:hypothetical protein PR202_gb28187 [Eleusine coracana subsp. coracana]